MNTRNWVLLTGSISDVRGANGDKYFILNCNDDQFECRYFTTEWDKKVEAKDVCVEGRLRKNEDVVYVDVQRVEVL